jgi:hypothetical protein
MYGIDHHIVLNSFRPKKESHKQKGIASSARETKTFKWPAATTK